MQKAFFFFRMQLGKAVGFKIFLILLSTSAFAYLDSLDVTIYFTHQLYFYNYNDFLTNVLVPIILYNMIPSVIQFQHTKSNTTHINLKLKQFYNKICDTPNETQLPSYTRYSDRTTQFLS